MRLPGTRAHLSESRIRPARGVALLLCLGAALSMVGGQIHAVSVRHERCLAHGELEHVAGPAAAPESAQPTAQGTTPAGVEGHDHCAIASAVAQSLSQKRTVSVSLLAPPEVRERPPATVPRHAPPRATVLLAPKTSPPSA